MTDSKLPIVHAAPAPSPTVMFRDPLAIEKCRLESILWARRIAGGGPDHIFYESDNEGFIVRCITDLHERRDRARASGLCSCGAERAAWVSSVSGLPRSRPRPAAAPGRNVHSGGAVRPQWVCDRGRTRPAEVSAAP